MRSIDAAKKKIAFWTPYLYSKRGNSTTARRIVAGLQYEGYEVEVFAYTEDPWNDGSRERMDDCDILHILHFYRFVSWQKENNYQINKPYLLTSGGTDVHQNIDNHLQRKKMKELITNADAVTVFTNEAADILKSMYPIQEDRVFVIPQSVWIPDKVKQKSFKLREGYPNILLPAGLRAVKDVFCVFEALKLLQVRYPMLKFTIVGEPLEEDVYEEVRKHQEIYSWFDYIRGVPLSSMYELYDWADIVINTSHSEGQPLTLMEAMNAGKPVIARSNAGNESLIEDKVDGFIYHNPDEFMKYVLQLISNKNLYRQISNHAKQKASTKFSLDREIKQYEQIYQTL
ncbi:glycosyltransferase family 4 protein [Pseudalkalibacillus decolorationis]|uniref:glycosyltransferase family 4 protein n=1 Tax=Pseudalkalibacillus decolorationis TaxID=163879 RepID=UPI00214995BD|nr:glycosyltransferase family 4 protein [Pseudalkalibacillus decolorationis]